MTPYVGANVRLVKGAFTCACLSPCLRGGFTGRQSDSHSSHEPTGHVLIVLDFLNGCQCEVFRLPNGSRTIKAGTIEILERLLSCVGGSSELHDQILINGIPWIVQIDFHRGKLSIHKVHLPSELYTLRTIDKGFRVQPSAITGYRDGPFFIDCSN